MKRKRRARRPEGHVYRRGQIWWFKWIGADHRMSYRSSGSTDREVAENMLRVEIERKTKGLPASPDPRLCLVDDLVDALEARYTTEGRRSLERLKFSKEHVLRLFKGVQAMRVTGADVLRYAQLRLGEKAAPATVNRELAALRAAYRLGLDNEVITAMPRIKLLPENNVRTGFADAAQVEAVCKRLKAEVADGVRFALLTGWRRTEVCSRWRGRRWTGAGASSGSSPAPPRIARAARSR
jgi:integrase